MYSIFVIGCGATGSNLMTFLSQYAISEKKIKSITLIDQDIVEEKNFINQKFTVRDIFKCKSQVLATRYKKLGININYVESYITSSEQMISIINTVLSEYKKNIPIIVSCVDNNKARRVLHETFCNMSEIIYIDTGNGTVDRNGQTVAGLKHNNKVITPPVAELYPDILNEAYDDLDAEKQEITYHCSDVKEHPQNLSTNVLSATITFLTLTNIISFNKWGQARYLFDAENITIK